MGLFDRLERILWLLLVMSVVVGVDAINEGVRNSEPVTGIVMGAVAVGLFVAWRVLRWLFDRGPKPPMNDRKTRRI